MNNSQDPKALRREMLVHRIVSVLWVLVALALAAGLIFLLAGRPLVALILGSGAIAVGCFGLILVVPIRSAPWVFWGAVVFGWLAIGLFVYALLANLR